jgi:hypothetical protein
MPSYQSRNQPRRHTTLTGRINNVERYDRFYDITFDALQGGRFPQFTLTAGHALVRVMTGPYDPRQIPPGSSVNTANRFSGPRLDGRPGQGALYLGTTAGVLREHAHYTLLQKSSGLRSPVPPLWKPGSSDQTTAFMGAQRSGASPTNAATKFYLLRVEQALRFADLRVTSLGHFMTELRGSARRYGIDSSTPLDFLSSAASISDDYSASRGIADSVFDQRNSTGNVGVCAFSSRADTDSGIVLMSSDNPSDDLVFAIFGSDSTIIPALTPVPASATQLGFDRYSDVRAALVSHE